MKPFSFADIFQHLNLAVFTFDRQLNLLHTNTLAQEWIAQCGKETPRRLKDLFPEIIGSESHILAVLEGKQPVFRLEYLNRQCTGQALRYFHFTILPAPDSRNGLLVLEDVTLQGLQVQMLRQQENERRLSREMAVLRRRFINEGILGRSPAIEHVRQMVRKLQNAPQTTVLLQGESGTGKNLVARVIHFSSMPPDAPFVEINCAALPENLLESELFGYEKGAFTHASTTRIGLLEEANGGTLFLDEIGELPLPLQAKLLSVLETKRFRRLGSNREIQTSARFIVATNRNLKQAVVERTFREDLYYRLNVVVIQMPPLRALGEDILLLARHFLQIYNLELKKQVKGFTPAAEAALLQHHWPGNVRELSNCIERAMIFAEKEYLGRSDLILDVPLSPMQQNQWEVPPEGIQLEEVEKQLLRSALQKARGNKTRAAQLLGLSRDTLRYRLQKYGLK